MIVKVGLKIPAKPHLGIRSRLLSELRADRITYLHPKFKFIWHPQKNKSRLIAVANIWFQTATFVTKLFEQKTQILNFDTTSSKRSWSQNIVPFVFWRILAAVLLSTLFNLSTFLLLRLLLQKRTTTSDELGQNINK